MNFHFAVGVLGQEWETSEIETVTPYKAFTNQEIHAKVGIKIGLGSVNITLKGWLIFFKYQFIKKVFL